MSSYLVSTMTPPLVFLCQKRYTLVRPAAFQQSIRFVPQIQRPVIYPFHIVRLALLPIHPRCHITHGSGRGHILQPFMRRCLQVVLPYCGDHRHFLAHESMGETVSPFLSSELHITKGNIAILDRVRVLFDSLFTHQFVAQPKAFQSFLLSPLLTSRPFICLKR